MQINPDVLPLHRTAVLESVDVVSAVTPDDLAKPTPCAGWTLADLLAHMTVQHHGFAAAAHGRGADLTLWDPATVADAVAADPAGAYAASTAEVLDAFVAPGVLDATFALPNSGLRQRFPGQWRSGFISSTTWCTAGMSPALSMSHSNCRTTSSPRFCHSLSRFQMVISRHRRLPVRTAVATDGEVSDLDRIVAHLGRSPGWTPPA
jgi:hypothetical protein